MTSIRFFTLSASVFVPLLALAQDVTGCAPTCAVGPLTFTNFRLSGDLSTVQATVTARPNVFLVPLEDRQQTGATIDFTGAFQTSG